jgi:hypothetical protein
MRLPLIRGVIRRRILVNFRIDPDVIQKILPAPFRPKLHAGKAVAGICLIRLEHIRPRGVPRMFGLSSENAAHRIAVVWKDKKGKDQEGVFIPRRDTASFFTYMGGGRLFPGEHQRAAFTIDEDASRIRMDVASVDKQIHLQLDGRAGESLPATSHFRNVEEASRFFEGGCVGYSVTQDPHRLDGICLVTQHWRVEPLEVTRVFSSYFSDEKLFPKGSAVFDCALIMRNLNHEWRRAQDFYV